MKDAGQHVARLLMRIGGFSITTGEPFTYTSGLISPVYCDNRRFLSFPDEREEMLQRLYLLIRETTHDWDVVAGVATAGIAFAAWIANEFRKPMIYVRRSPKGHGKQRRIEGLVQHHQRVILIEDVVTTGLSAGDAIDVLRAEGLRCDVCFSLFDYEFDSAREAFESRRAEHQSLTCFTTLMKVAAESQGFSETEIGVAKEWHRTLSRAVASP